MNDLIADVAWALRDALALTDEADDPDVDPEVVLRAAAQSLGGSLTASNGFISNGTASLSYGSLAAAAAQVTLPGNTPLNQYPRTLVSLGLLPLALTARLQPTAATVRRNRPQRSF